MNRLSLGISFFWSLVAFFPAEAWGHALSCTSSHNYTYYTEDSSVASKCKYNFDDDCVWKGTSINCQWQGSYKGAAKTTTKTTKTDTATATKDKQPMPTKNNASQQDPPPATAVAPQLSFADNRNNLSPSTDPEDEDDSVKPPKPQVSYTPPIPKDNDDDDDAKAAALAKKMKELEEAKKEAKISSGKVEELKLTMEEIKVNNENNAILYRSPDANVGSVDPRFNAFNAAVSGELGNSNAAGGLAGGLLGKAGLLGQKKSKDKSGRGLASNANGEVDIAKDGDKSGASTKGEGNSATSDNPWVNYMGQTSKAGLIDRLRKNPGLRDSLRDRIAELQSKGDQSGVVELMEEALASAEKESQGPSLDDLKPMAFMEAFSMDSAETEAQIRSLLADLDTASDPQFLPQISLFERVSVAHRRSLVRGTVKTTR